MNFISKCSYVSYILMKLCTYFVGKSFARLSSSLKIIFPSSALVFAVSAQGQLRAAHARVNLGHT